MFKRALVSTSDKTGLVEFLRPFMERGMEVVSTGGTSKFLREQGLQVTEVAAVTGFPEVMDGRVRTLHPKIHMGLLARSQVPEDFKLLKEHGVTPFDLVVVNLYPFEDSFKRGLKGEELIEQIDIGGPSLLRAAAKTHERVTVLCSPQDYGWVGERVQSGNPLGLSERRQLAARVYAHTSFYDSMVARALSEGEDGFAEEMTLGMRLHSLLRYGENPHQKAAWYVDPFAPRNTLAFAEQLQGKELSYNNILDSEAALQCLRLLRFPAAVIVKHNTPCGAAQAANIIQAYQNALRGDPVSAFGGIVALSEPVDGDLAQQLTQIFLECVIAPDFSPQALSVLASKKNLRLLKLPTLKTEGGPGAAELRSLQGGFLVQQSDLVAHQVEDVKQFKVLGQSPDRKTWDDLVLLFNIARMVKSNAIVVGAGGQTLGICGGQTNRVDAVRFALERARHITDLKNWILASDAFFPFRDSIDLAAQYGVRYIIQPGGSLRDAEVEQAAHEHGMTMILTGKRHFKH